MSCAVNNGILYKIIFLQVIMDNISCSLFFLISWWCGLVSSRRQTIGRNQVADLNHLWVYIKNYRHPLGPVGLLSKLYHPPMTTSHISKSRGYIVQVLHLDSWVYSVPTIFTFKSLPLFPDLVHFLPRFPSDVLFQNANWLLYYALGKFFSVKSHLP